MERSDDDPIPVPREFAIEVIDKIHAADPGAVEAWADGRDDVEVRGL